MINEGPRSLRPVNKNNKDEIYVGKVRAYLFLAEAQAKRVGRVYVFHAPEYFNNVEY